MGLLADALKAAKPALLQLLRGAGIAKDVEAYFARTVDATLDLKDTIYLGAAKQMLPVRARRHLVHLLLGPLQLCCQRDGL